MSAEHARSQTVHTGPLRESTPWIGVKFACASAYVRVYRARDGRSYYARCPKCGYAQRFIVSEGGTDCRFFEITC